MPGHFDLRLCRASTDSKVLTLRQKQEQRKNQAAKHRSYPEPTLPQSYRSQSGHFFLPVFKFPSGYIDEADMDGSDPARQEEY
jgi:hypothetical protein